MAMAMRVETRVPKMLLAAPKDSVTGFQSSENKNPRPNFLRAGREELIRSTPMASITRGTSREQAKVSQRKAVSLRAETCLCLALWETRRRGGVISLPVSAVKTLFFMSFKF
jgi:hypothetical protein